MDDRYLFLELNCVPSERLLRNHEKTLRFQASRGDKFNLGLVMRLNHSELLCNKVLLKYKKIKEIEKASDIDIRRGQKECPLLVFRRMLYSY